MINCFRNKCLLFFSLSFSSVNEAASVGPVFDLLEPPIENFTVEVEEICAFFDVENLDQTVPLLCLRSSLDTKAVNWSKHVSTCTMQPGPEVMKHFSCSAQQSMKFTHKY